MGRNDITMFLSLSPQVLKPLQGLSINFYNFLHKKSCSSFAEFIPRYHIVFIATVNGMLLQVKFSKFLLLTHESITSFKYAALAAMCSLIHRVTVQTVNLSPSSNCLVSSTLIACLP